MKFDVDWNRLKIPEFFCKLNEALYCYSDRKALDSIEVTKEEWDAITRNPSIVERTGIRDSNAPVWSPLEFEGIDYRVLYALPWLRIRLVKS